MKTNQLSNQAKEVLLAFFKDGAKPGELHSTTLEKIIALLKWNVGKESNEALDQAIRELVMNNFTFEDENTITVMTYIASCMTYKNGDISVRLNVPLGHAKTLQTVH